MDGTASPGQSESRSNGNKSILQGSQELEPRHQIQFSHHNQDASFVLAGGSSDLSAVETVSVL